MIIPLMMLLLSLLSVSSGQECSMTPTTLESDFLEKCSARVTGINCTVAWRAFAKSFEKKDPSDVSGSDYEDYFDVLPIVTSANQNLFWSGTFQLARLVSCMCSSGADIVSSSNTPSSAIITDIGATGEIYWCGNLEGIDYDNPCLCDVTNNFWNQFSVEFATVAEGTIFFLGYGEREGGTYKTTSAFARYEIPNLEYPRVTDAVVLNVHRKGEGEACGEGSLINLQSRLESKSFSYSCYDIYGDLMGGNQTLESLSACASRIIASIQQGREPEPNDCFSAQVVLRGSVTVVILLAVLAIIKLLN